ncbi:MAG: glutaredoxin family protein [bacterium]|nr:glutaredoxin family protein [Rhodocyclaceae bacterium]
MHRNRTDITVRLPRRRRLARASAPAMMVAGALLLGLSTLPGEAAAQQIRCWTTDSGSRECSDMPPPPAAKAINEVRGRAGRIEGQESFAQRQASERFPVTLWSNDCGEPCTSARKLLASRGIPFTERNPSLPALQEEFKRVTKGQMQVPLLIVGTAMLVGYEEGQWNSTLDAAGYSRTPGPARRPAAPPTAQPQPASPPAPTTGPGGAILPPQGLSPVPGSPGGPGTPPVSPAGPAGSGAIPR